ncbi:MAG: hypothetical protein HYZ28_27880 [Myxococcales bacterium]|nr:hypothetical protein [Myxococcales bacterium]
MLTHDVAVGGGWDAPRSIATFDLSPDCVLRCAHCYFFTSDLSAAQLGDEELLRRLAEVRDGYGLRSALWVGGEPLLRAGVLRRAIELFPRNAVVTSGMVPIPPDLEAGVLVSVEGPEDLHDRLRGRGAFGRVEQQLSALPARAFGLMVTLTRSTLAAIERLPEVVERTRALGAMVGFYVGQPDAEHRVDGSERDRAVDRLLEVSRRHPGVVLNTRASLELFRPSRAKDWAQGCIYRDRAIAFDPLLRPKSPCTYGGYASCEICGCPVVAAQISRAMGDGPSDELLRTLFVRRAPPAAAA